MKLIFRNREFITPEEKKKNNKLRLYSVISGLLLGLSFPPLPFPYLLFVALIPYLIILDKSDSLININRKTYLMGFLFSVTSIYWVGSWQENADSFLLIGGTLLLFINPIFFLIPSTLYFFTRKIFNRKIALILLPFFWVFYEYVYGITDLRFPWLSLSNGLPYFTSYIQIADIIGAPGLTFLIVASNILFYEIKNDFIIGEKISKTKISILILFILFPIIYGRYQIESYKDFTNRIKVGIVQPDFDPWEKQKETGFYKQLDVYLSLSEEVFKQDAKLVLWPESALPSYLLSGSHTDAVSRIQNLVTNYNAFLITGMPDIKFYFDKNNVPEDAKKRKEGGIPYTTYNSTLLFSYSSYDIQRYGKIKLVPFGERTPFVDYIPALGELLRWNVGLSGWNIGKDTLVFKLNENQDTINTAGIICYESIFPDFVSSFVNKGAEFISVVTNDSWYGNSSGPYQHKEISALRAVENRRYVVRCANGGISCVINPLGITTRETKMFERTSFVESVGLSSEKTFYTQFPLIIPYSASLVSIVIIILYLFKKIFKRWKK